jgi:acyl-CoA thioesterase I
MSRLDSRVCRTANRWGVALTRYDLGVRRDTSELILRRAEREVSARLDRVPCDGRVVFSFGTNDVAVVNGELRIEPFETLANSKRLLLWFAARYPTLMIGPPPIACDPEHNSRVATLSVALRALCGELGVAFLDVHGPLSIDAIWTAAARAGDGVHPKAGGYKRLARIVKAWEPWRAWFA